MKKPEKTIDRSQFLSMLGSRATVIGAGAVLLQPGKLVEEATT
jgi:hypothetical protein